MFIQNQSLKHLNTFGLESNAASFAIIQSEEQLTQLLQKAQGQHIHVLGGGSNVILQPQIEGLVLLNKIGQIKVENIRHNEVIISIGSGVNWHQLVLWSLKKGFGGLENLALIPGTVGAAPIQNIGAYGVELKDVFESLEAIELKTGKRHRFTSRDCQFSYRDSIFKQENLRRKFYLSKIFLRLSINRHEIRQDYGSIRQKLDSWNVTQPTPNDIAAAVIHIRRSKLPDWNKIGNAGSFFKNPVISKEQANQLREKHPKLPSYPMKKGKVKLAAGWLIDQCGWKGKRAKNVGCFEKQALVIVNHGHATGEEIISFSKLIIDNVMDKFGVILEREVRLIG